MSEVKILLCDDDPDLQGLLVRRLKKMGIEPDAAGDGRVAKGFVDDNLYDVIVTDIYMLGGDRTRSDGVRQAERPRYSSGHHHLIGHDR